MTRRERQQRVAEIREQVQNGTYKIDALELSKKIIDKHTVPAPRTRAAQP